MKWARRTMFDKRSINIDWTLAWRVWLRNHCLRSWYMAMTWAEWMVSREQPGCDGDGNGWSKSTFTNAAHVMRGPSSADTWHDARTARQKYKWWKYLSLLKCPRFLGQICCVIWSAELPSQIARISMKFQIVVLRHVALTMGILRHFLPWRRKKDQFPQRARQRSHESSLLRCKSFVGNRKSRVPEDSYVTTGWKSLLSVSELHYFFLASIRFLLSQKYFDLQMWGA